MSLWGNSDSLYSTGTVSINLTTKVATFGGGATLPAAATVEGAVLTVTGKGSAVILERTSGTTATIVNTTGLDGTAISGVTYNISGQPVYLNEDSNWGGLEVYGVDTAEQAFTASGSAATAEQKKYNPTMLVGLVLLHTLICTVISELRLRTLLLVARLQVTQATIPNSQNDNM